MGTVVVAVVVAVVAELASLGPFAAGTPVATTSYRPAQSAGTPAPLRTPSSMPEGQWIATGTVAQAYEVAGRTAGQRLVRAWIFDRVCTAGVACHTDFELQNADGSVAQAVLVHESNGSFHAVFPTTVNPCAYGGSGQDHYSMNVRWLSARELSGDSLETFTAPTGGCTPGAFDAARWTVTPVVQAATPTLTIWPGHAATVGAFRAAAQRACSSANTEAVPLAAKLLSLERTARTANINTVRANAETRIAGLLAAVLPLLVKQYTGIPQPPTGASDTLWLTDIAAIRRQLQPAAAMFAALQNAARTASLYFRTGNPLDAQRILTTPALITDDALKIAGPGDTSNAIESKLRLPKICTREPAIASIFSSSATLST